MITDINSEQVLKKIRNILTPAKKTDDIENIMSNPAMLQRLQESRAQITGGNGVKISLDDIWK